MKATIGALLLIALGVVALTYGGLGMTTREKVVDLGPLEITKEETKTIPLPPILGGVAIAAGVVILLVGARRRN